MPVGFAGETAAATGKSKRSVNQAIHRAENIEPDVMEAVQGTTRQELETVGAPQPTVTDLVRDFAEIGKIAESGKAAASHATDSAAD